MRVRVKLGSGKGRQGFVGRGRSWNFILVAMRVIEYFLLRLRTHAHAHSFPGSPFFPPRASSLYPSGLIKEASPRHPREMGSLLSICSIAAP